MLSNSYKLDVVCPAAIQLLISQSVSFDDGLELAADVFNQSYFK
jgi:hypothetical protein